MAETSTQYMVYSSVTATLSHQFITAIPGLTVDVLSGFLKLDNVTLNYTPEPQIYSLTGTLKDIVECEDCLRTWITGVRQSATLGIDEYTSLINHSEEKQNKISDENRPLKFDKGIACDILKPPVVTRSGRVVRKSEKSKYSSSEFIAENNESVNESEADVDNIDDMQNVNDRQTPEPVLASNKRRRGRPKKVQPLVDENQTQDEPKNIQNTEDMKVKTNTLESDILQQSLTITKALENEIENADSLTSFLPESGDSSDLINISGNDSKTLAANLDDKKKDSLANELKESFKESVANIYLNKAPPTEEKHKRNKKQSSKTNGDDDKEEMKKWKQGYEQKMPYKYFCTKCSYKSKRESHFKLHKKLHLSKPDMPLYKCDECSFTAIRQSVLHKHRVSHLENVLTCSSCDYKTNNVVHLTNHMKNRHDVKSDTKPSAPSGEWLSCNVCPYRTKQQSAYTKHYLSHGLTFTVSEDGKIKTYKCNFCSYTAQRKEHLVRHKTDRHGNNRPYLCDLCGMAFKRIDALAAHKITHTDKSQRRLPYKCPTCKKAFKSRAHLKEHLAVHTSLRAYLCDICGVSFKTRAVQKKHVQNIHLNPGSFKCSTCPKTFNTKYALQKHNQHHEFGTAYKSSRATAKKSKKDEISADPFGIEGQGQIEPEGHIEAQVQGDDLQVQEVQLQFQLPDYGNHVTMVTDDNQLVGKEEGQILQIVEDHEFAGQPVQGHDLLEQVQDDNLDENLTAIQTITLPTSQFRQLTQSIHSAEGDKIYIENFPVDDGNSFVDPSQETVPRFLIPPSMDNHTSIIELDGNTTLIQEIQGDESLIEEVKNLSSLEGLQPNQRILAINIDGTEKIFVANLNSGDVENL